MTAHSAVRLNSHFSRRKKEKKENTNLERHGQTRNTAVGRGCDLKRPRAVGAGADVSSERCCFNHQSVCAPRHVHSHRPRVPTREINYQLFSLILVYTCCETEYVRVVCYVSFVLEKPWTYETHHRGSHAQAHSKNDNRHNKTTSKINKIFINTL